MILPIQRRNPITGEMEYINKEKDPKTAVLNLGFQLAEKEIQLMEMTRLVAELEIRVMIGGL